MSGLRRYSVEEKHAMVHWAKKGHTYSQIAKTINGVSGAKTTTSGVRKYLLRHKLSGSIGSTGYQRKFQERRKLSLLALAVVNQYVAEDRELVHSKFRENLAFISTHARPLQ